MMISMKIRTIMILLILSTSFAVNNSSNGQQVEKPTYYTKTLVANGTGTPEVFKLMAYNILETGKNPEWKDVVKEENPDILVAVETGKWEGPNDGVLNSIKNEFNEYFADEKPYQVWATSDNPSSTAGEAIFSRYDIINGTTIAELTLDDGSKKEAHNPFMDVVVNISGVVTHIFGVHLKCCDSGTGAEQRNREQDTEGILNYMDQLGNVPIIYAGDLNSFNPFDVKVLNAGTNLGYGPLEIMLNSSNPHASQIHEFKDVYRELNPYDYGFTFVDKFYKSRIDFIVVNQYFFDMMINSTVSTASAVQKGSDHFPVQAWFNLNPELADLRPPARIYNVSANLASNGVQLKWDPSPAEDFSYYSVYRNGTFLENITTTSFTDTETADNAVYNYQVSATDNSSNEGFLSHPLYVNSSYGTLTPPSAPISLTLEKGINNLTIRWQKPESTGGARIKIYNIYRSTNPNGIFIIYGRTTGFEFTDTKTISAFTYYYKVTAENVIGESEFSEMVSGKPLAPQPTNNTTEETTSAKSPITMWAVFATMIAAQAITAKKSKKIKI